MTNPLQEPSDDIPDERKPSLETIEFACVRFSDYVFGVVLLAAAGGIVWYAMRVAFDEPYGSFVGRVAIVFLAVGVAVAIAVAVVSRWRRTAAIEVGQGWLRHTRRSPLADFPRHWRLEEIDSVESHPLRHWGGKNDPGPGVRLEFVGGGFYPVYTATESEARRLLERLSTAIARDKSLARNPSQATWVLDHREIAVAKAPKGVRLTLARQGWRGRELAYAFGGAMFALGATFVFLLVTHGGWPSTINQGTPPAVAIIVACVGWLVVLDFLRMGFVTRVFTVDATGVEVVSRGLFGVSRRRFATDELESLDVGPFRLSSRDGLYFPQLVLFLKGGRVRTIAQGD